MGDEAGTVGDRSARAWTRPARRRVTALGTSFRAAVAVLTAFVLALPLFGLAESVQAERAFAVDPDPACVAGSGATATAESPRESVAARAAALWFPAEHVSMATAIAGAESSWNPTAVNKAAGGNYGLWQINSVHDNLLRGRNWREPDANAWMAYQVWDAADGRKGDGKGSWKPWSVYNSGSFRAYLRDSAPTGAGDCVATGASEVRVATWNVLMSNSRARIEAGVRDLTTRADVFGLQELGSSSDRAAAARGADGFTMTTDRTAVPIFYRTDKYTALAQGREKAFAPGQKVERYGGKGSNVTAAKWVTWVQLQDNATLQSFYVLNTHLIVGAYNSEKQRKNNDRRVALYKRQLATVTALADGFRASGAAVYVTCDCNVNYDADADPVETMGESGLTANWQHLDGEPTLGKRRYIDYVWSTRTPAAQFVGEKHGSDHASVTVRYESSTDQSATMTPVNGSPRQTIYSMRTITDPSSGRTYLVPVPLGDAGLAITKALDEVGDRWKFGGHGPEAWDCSGLTAGAWRAANVSFPAQSEEQQRRLRNIKLAAAEPGDIFWQRGYVAIYLGMVGGDRLVVGSRESKGAVVIHTMDESDIKAVLRPTG